MVEISKVNPITFELQTYEPQDENLIASSSIDTQFVSLESSIEFFIYDLNNNIISENYNYVRYNVQEDGQAASQPIPKISQFNISPGDDVTTLGFDNGGYVAYYNFLNNEIGNSNSTLFISEISSDRTEIRLDSTEDINIVSESNKFIDFRDNQDYFVDFYLNFGSNNLVIANNINLANETTDNPTIIIKLYEPLPIQFDLRSTLWVVTTLNEPEAFLVNYPPETIELTDFTQIQGPNFNIPIKGQVNNSSQPLSYTDITSGASTGSQNQVNSLLSQSAINISVDYTDFNNFINFSSAQTRIENFYYKVGLIESYTSSSNTFTNVTSSETTKLIEDKKISNVIDNFDKFEYFMYYSSGSAAYPKLVIGVGERATSLPPYILLPSTSSQVLTWLGSANENNVYFGGQLLSASNYDNANPDQLLKSIPEYLREDPANKQYDLFVDMVAQYYDNVWLYTKDITQKYNADNRLDFGVSKDLVSDAIKDFGVKLYQNNFSNSELYTAFLGITPNGSLFPYPEASFTTPVPTGKEFIDNLILPQGNVGALSPVDNQLSSSISYPPSGETYYANDGVPGTYTLLVDSGIISVSKGQGATLQFTVAADGSISNITTILGGSGYKVGDRILLNDDGIIPKQGGGTTNEIEFLLQEKDILNISSVTSLDDANKSLYKRLYHNIPYLLKSKGTLAGLRALITSYGIPDTILRISEFGGKDQVNANDYDLYQNNFNYAFNTSNNFVSSSWAVNSDWNAISDRPSTVQFRFKAEEFPPTNLSQSLFSLYNGSTLISDLVLEYTGSGLTSSSLYNGSIKDPYYQYANLKWIPNTSTANNSASIYLPFFDKGWWSVMITSGSSNGFELTAANKIYNGNDGTSIGYISSSNINSGTWSTSTIAYFATSSTQPSFSGSLQEIRYYNTIISESVFKDFIMNPLSFEGNGINSAPDQLIFRAALGSELVKANSLADGTLNQTSIHPRVTGSWTTTSSFASDSKFYFNNTSSYSTNTEYFFLDQPAAGIKNRITDKIRSEKDHLPTGNTLSPIRKLNQITEASASYTDNINYLEVAFSPQNQINDDIIGQMGHFNIGDYIGDPSERFTGDNYPDLNDLSEEYFKKYIKQYDLTDFVRLIKFFDNSLFKMIKDFIPARTGLASGIVIKQHLLERNKYSQPQVSQEELLISGSIPISAISGGAGGSFNEFNSTTTSPSGSLGQGPNNRYNITQSWSVTTPSLSGSITTIQDDQAEFYNGEFSGSDILVTNGELNEECDQFKNTNFQLANYKIRMYSDLEYSQSAFINTSNDPQNGYISIFTSFAQPPSAPSVTTLTPSSVSQTEIIVDGNITSTGSSNLTEKGFYFGTNSTVTLNPKTIITPLLPPNNFDGDFDGLIASTTYYITAYAKNSVGETIGNTVVQSTSAGIANTPTSFKVYNTVSNSTSDIAYYTSPTTDFIWNWNEGTNNGDIIDISSSQQDMGNGYTRLLPTNQFGDVIYDFDLNNISVITQGNNDVTSEWTITKEGGSTIGDPDRIKFQRNANPQVLERSNSKDNIYLNFDITSSITTAGTTVIGDASFNIKPAIDINFPYAVSGITHSLYNKIPEYNIASTFYSLDSSISLPNPTPNPGNNSIFTNGTSVKTFSNGYSASPTAVESAAQFRNGVGSDILDGTSVSLSTLEFVSAGGGAEFGSGNAVNAWSVDVDNTTQSNSYFSISISTDGYLEIGYDGTNVGEGLPKFYWVYFYVQDLNGLTGKFAIPKETTQVLWSATEYKIFAVKVKLES